MNRNKLFVTLVLSVLMLSSCREKRYECWCVDSICGVGHPIKATSKKKAQNECDHIQSYTTGATCSLEADDN